MSDDLLIARQEFISEILEGLEVMSASILQLENDPQNVGAAREFFRVVHTVKGNASFFGFRRIEQLCHALEEVLVMVKSGKTGITPHLINALLTCGDTLRGLVEELDQEDGPHGLQVPFLEEKLLVLCGKVEADTNDAGVSGENISRDEETLSLFTEELTGESVLKDSTVRVSTQVLDKLMNLVGELVLTRNQLLQDDSQRNQQTNQKLQRLSNVTSSLQESILKTRMQPVASLFAAIPRQAREICQGLNKEAIVVSEGGETELDRTLLEGLKDALTHLVRNSLDHGIEDPHTRQDIGKPPRGKITLKAFHEGGRVNVVVVDDGRGVDTEAVKLKALTMGLLTEVQAGRLSQEEVLGLIFNSGFSTKTTTTNISGRGVGMDVVKSRIEALGGTVALQSNFGEGTRVHLTLPLTLAILPALMLKCGEHTLALPQGMLREVVQLIPENFDNLVREVSGGAMLKLREKLLPLYGLSEVLGNGEGVKPGTFALVIDAGGKHLVLAVDEVMECEEIVVKPLSRELSNLGLYSGATILGNGEAALILDPVGIARRIHLREEQEVQHELKDQNVEDQGEPLLLVRQGEVTLGIRLGEVQRLELVPVEEIKPGAGRRVWPYRGGLLTLVLPQDWLPVPKLQGAETYPVVVLNGEMPVGFLVEEILDTLMVPLDKLEGTPVPGIEAERFVMGRAVWIIEKGKIQQWAGKTVNSSSQELPKVQKEVVQTHYLGRKRRVLVVDDSKTVRHVLRNRLEAEGYEVDEAEDGVQGLRQLTRQTPDIVISDVNMPNMDGISFVSEIREKEVAGKHLPVIAVSNEREAEVVQRGKEAGFDDYLFKLNVDEVIEALETRFRLHIGDDR